MAEDIMQRIVARVLSQHPDLWEMFRIDPEAAIRSVGIELTGEEWTAVREAGRRQAAALKPKADPSKDLAAKLKADLEKARAEQALDYNPLADDLARAHTTEESSTPLDDAREDVESKRRRMKEALAEEQRRVQAERERALRLLRGKKKEEDKS